MIISAILLGTEVISCSIMTQDLTVHLLQTRRKCPLSIFSEELLVQILGSVLTLCVTNQEWMRVLASQKFIALIQR